MFYIPARIILLIAVALGIYVAVSLTVAASPWSFLIWLLLIASQAKRSVQALTSGGTARYASYGEVQRASGMGLPLGRLFDFCKPSFLSGINAVLNPFIGSRRACVRLIESITSAKAPIVWLKTVHSVIFAPTRAGKGVSIIVNFLRNCKESAVVFDPKGELYKLTHKARRRMGHTVVVLDPWRMAVEAPDRFNPLDSIKKDSPNAIDECRDYAEAITVRGENEHQPHFNDMAEAFNAAVTAGVVAHGKTDRSFQTVAEILSNKANLVEVVVGMTKSPAWGGLLSRMAFQLTHAKGEELGGVLTTVTRHLRFMSSPAVVESLSSSTFDPDDLRKKKITVYMIVPPEHIRTQMGLLRLWLVALFYACVRGGLGEKRRVHFVLDEA